MADIKEHMEVIGADALHVGTVDKVRGPRPAAVLNLCGPADVARAGVQNNQGHNAIRQLANGLAATAKPTSLMSPPLA